MAYTDLRFGSGTGSIFIDNADCVGDELRLTSCRYDSHTADCTHAEDAGLRCSGRCKPNHFQVKSEIMHIWLSIIDVEPILRLCIKAITIVLSS